MNKRISFLIVALLSSASVHGAPAAAVPPSSGMPNTVSGANAQAGVAVQPASQPKVIPSYKNYTFYGDRYRDPFIPLIGEARGDQGDRTPAVASLVLKGIVEDAKGRMALLSSGVNSYILRGGRLYDGNNRMIKKISGVIKSDSVVVVGADRTVRELKQRSSL